MADQHSVIISLHPDARLVAATPEDQNIFFGFHDITPWSPDGGHLLCLRLQRSWQAMTDTDEMAEVCFWNPDTGAIKVIGQTNCWNFQQGARQQWSKDYPPKIIYNRTNAGNTLEATIFDPEEPIERVYAGGLYAFSPDGAWAVSPDFEALSDRWPAYGYRQIRGANAGKADHAVGLWRTDLESGERTLLVTLANVLEIWDHSAAATGHFLTHPSISPDGSTIVFLHRFFAADGGSFTRLLCCWADGSNLQVLGDEKVSHFDWLDNDRLLVWARFTGGGLAQMRATGTLNSPFIRPILNLIRRFSGRWKKRVLSESYYTIPIGEPERRKKFGWPSLDLDGHPMVARSHDWIVTDTYPDQSGTLVLMLWNRATETRVDIATFKDGVTSDDSDAKCDLHPRWNRDETQIAVDYCANGVRGIAIIDVAKIIEALP